MKQPWTVPEGWEAIARDIFNLTEGTPEWEQYSATTHAFYRNSFGVPCLASYIILFGALLVVLLGTIQRWHGPLYQAYKDETTTSTELSWSHRILQAPAFGTKHVVPYEACSGWLSIKVPLRGHAVLIGLLALCNIIPLTCFYTPYEPNFHWPNDALTQVGRYVADRAGVLATAQVAPVILLSGRNNLVVYLTGATFNTCMLYHRWFSRFVMMQATVHAIGYSVVTYHRERYQRLFTHPYILWGLAAIIGFGGCVFMSLRYLRNKSYELFIITHIGFSLIALIGLYYHIALLRVQGYAIFVDCILASTAFWAFDRTARLMRKIALNFGFHTKSGSPGISKARVRFLDAGETVLSVRIYLRGAAKTWVHDAAGKYIQLWVPRIQLLSSHPFTVIQVDRTESSTALQLYVRVYDGVTRRLAKRIQQCDKPYTELYMLAEGMYGQRVMLSPNEHPLLVAGGVGITAILPYFRARLESEQDATLLWLLKDPALIRILVECLESTSRMDTAAAHRLEAVSPPKPARASIRIYLTKPGVPAKTARVPSQCCRAVGEDRETDALLCHADVPLLATSNKWEDAATCIRCLSAIGAKRGFDVQFDSSGVRPDLGSLLPDTASEVADSNSAVICCGPAELCDAVRVISTKNGLGYHEEAFDW